MLPVTRFVLGVSLLTLAACGGDRDSASSTSGSPVTAAAPVEGKPATRTSQFEGTWFRRGDLSDDHLVGLEFSSDGQTITFVSAGSGGIQEATFPFVLLEDGRIRVTHPQFPTESQVAVIKIDGSALALEPETQSRRIGMIAASFDKLRGKTLRQRLEERIAEIQAEREKLREEIAGFLRQSHLVLVPDGLDAARIGLETGSEAGAVAYQRIGDVVIARRAQLGPVTENDGSPAAALQLGNVVGPPGAVDVPGETIRLKPLRGDNGRLMLASTGATMRSASGLHQSLERDYDALFQARRQIIDSFHARLGHFLFVQAEQTNPRVAPEQLAFMRVDGEDVYRVASLRANTLLLPSHFSGQAAVQLSNDKAQLRTNTHQIQPETDAADSAYIVSTRNGAQRFTILHRFTREEFDARRAECSALVSRMKNQPLQLVGVYRSSERGYIRPVRLALTSADGKRLAGSFHSDAVAIEGQIDGEIQESTLGLLLRVAVPRPSPHVVPGGDFTEAGTLTLALELENGTPKLNGRSDPGDSNNRFILAPPSSAANAQLRQQLSDHLNKGGQFKWDRTGSTGGSDEVLTMTLAADGTDRVTGSVGFRRGQTGAVAGQLSEKDGLVVLDLTVQPSADAPARRGGAGPMRLYLIPFEDGFHLSGYSKWDGENRTRYISYAPTDSI